MMSTKEKILQNATKLFLTKGYNQTSLNEIAKKSGITKGGIYHHFKDKDELFVEMAEYFKSRMFSVLHRMESEESLENLIKNYFENLEAMENEMADYLELTIKDIRMFSEFQSRFILDVIEHGPKDLNLCIHTKEMHKIIKSKIEQDKKNGFIRDNLDSDELSLEIMAIFEGYTVLRRSRLIDNAYGYGNKTIDALWNRIKK
ncbi:TetR/AcrR family transcriptional regulator [Methanococcus sp. CF]